jgi:hypothetical protein
MMATNNFPFIGWTNYAELNHDMSNIRIFDCHYFVHIPSARPVELRFAGQVYVGHNDASPASDHTKVVGTPNFINDVGTCASRVINSASISALPVDSIDLFFNKHAPFHDTVNPKTTFDIVDLGAWCSQGHNLISIDQLQQPSNDQMRPAVTNGGQPMQGCNPFWTNSDQLEPDSDPVRAYSDWTFLDNSDSVRAYSEPLAAFSFRDGTIYHRTVEA